MIEAALIVLGLVGIVGGGIWAANLPEEDSLTANECARTATELNTGLDVTMGIILIVMYSAICWALWKSSEREVLKERRRK